MINRKEQKKEKLKELNRVFEYELRTCIVHAENLVHDCKKYLDLRKEFPSEYTDIKELKSDLKRLRRIDTEMLKISTGLIFKKPGLSKKSE